MSYVYKILFVLLAMLACCGGNASGCPHPGEVERDTLRGSLYLKFNLDVKRRNVLLMLVPRMYSIYDDERYFVDESYGRCERLVPGNKLLFNEQLHAGNTRQGSGAFPMFIDYISPNLYDETLFDDNILSPFHKKNRRFYKYSTFVRDDVTYLSFRPRVLNSNLTFGSAMIDNKTQKVMSAHLRGAFDLITYGVEVRMDVQTGTPEYCKLRSRFKLLGNNVETTLLAHYKDTLSLPVGIKDTEDPELMKCYRTEPLNERETLIYDSVYAKKEATVIEEVSQNGLTRTVSGIGTTMYKYLLRRPSYRTDSHELSMSPVLDPLSIGYSDNTGVSYRIKLWASHTFGENKHISLAPRLGYNFKQKQFYFNAPLRYTFNSKKEGWLELYVSNGNQISSGLLLDKIEDIGRRDTIQWKNMHIDYFRDFQTSLKANIPLGKHLYAGVSAVYHRRSAVNPEKLEEMGQRGLYHSFAPSFTFIYHPSDYASYMFNYERSIPRFLNCDSRYERMEFDSQFAVRYNRLTSLNVRLGAGVYTDLGDDNYFVDYNMFSENYLPDAWDDDWTGRFFLLSSDLYNASRYYLRSNVSYESPILAAAYIPFLGFFIEKERVYVSNLQLHKTSIYTEMGYAFSTSYFSLGVFAGFFGRKCQTVGAKISIELFRRW